LLPASMTLQQWLASRVGRTGGPLWALFIHRIDELAT
jgi:hypothetical protein